MNAIYHHAGEWILIKTESTAYHNNHSVTENTTIDTTLRVLNTPVRTDRKRFLKKNINRRDAHIQFSICVQFTKETTDFMRIIFIFNSIGYQAERKDRFECEKKTTGKSAHHFCTVNNFFSQVFTFNSNCRLQIKLHRIESMRLLVSKRYVAKKSGVKYENT